MQDAIIQDAPSTGLPDVSLAEKVAFLLQPASYPADVGAVVGRETHMSWIFLAGERAYKLKKPVRFPFLDFSTLRRRAEACAAEHRLNRRLAPDVYLGVQPLTQGASGLALGGAGEVVDWLVVMRRLDERETLESALRTGRLQRCQVDRLAALLGAFYARTRRVRLLPERLLEAWHAAVLANRRFLLMSRFGFPEGMVERVVRTQLRFLRRYRGLLGERARRGRIVDAHGDLRPEHVWLRIPVTIIDCLEFDHRLRALDPLDEIAFLHLECERLGARWVGERVRRRLARRLAEDRRGALFLFYRSHRALLRARLSIGHLLDAVPSTPERWPRQARAYLSIALADCRRLESLLARSERGGA